MANFFFIKLDQNVSELNKFDLLGLVFSYAYKTEGMTQFDICHVFVENSMNSELCFFWALLKPAKIWNLTKNAHVLAFKNKFQWTQNKFSPLIRKILVWNF